MKIRLLYLIVLCASAIPAQQGPPEGLWQGFDGEWEHVSRQLLALAEAIPGEKFSWRPAEGVRSTAEVLNHVTAANFGLLSVTGTKVPSDLKMEGFEKRVTDKREVISWLKRSLDAVKAAHKGAKPTDLQREVKIAGRNATVDGMYLRIIVHANEHMGQLIAYARTMGVTPPWSQASVPPAGQRAAAVPPKIEEMRGKKVLLFTPHPDDDAFCCGGTLALLAKNGNTVRVAIYTNDDKGSYDPEMTGERLARIRKSEEEEGNRILGIPKENLLWLGHHDGLLEYVDSRRLVEQATEIIRRYRPDVVMTVDPGSDYVRWHKTDHRMAAVNTLDAIRAAEWHLYFPNQRLQLGLEPWKVPAMMFYYVTDKDANLWVAIDSVMDLKEAAGLAHVSQWEPAIRKYRPDWTPSDRETARRELRSMILRRDGRAVEAYRWATAFNQF